MSAVTLEPPAPPESASKPAPARRRPRPPRKPIRPGHPEEAMSIASSALTVIALVCVWVLLQLLVLGGISHARSQHLLYSELRSELAAATVPTGELDYDGKPVEAGAPVALLTIPTLGLQQVVVDGTSSSDLMAGPGHLRSTPMPGQAGISVVMGRARTYGGPFGRIAELRKGDAIDVLNATGQVSYTVIDVRRAGDPIPQPPTGSRAGRLTLVSAEGSGNLSALTPRSAVYVDAETAKATPAGVVAPISAAEQPLARDTDALPLLVLVLALLAAAVLAISAARRHFRAALVWTVAAPVVVALAWAITDQVTRLLPNLM